MTRALHDPHQSPIRSIFRSLIHGWRQTVCARPTVWVVAALAVLLNLPARSALAQGYMFGRASYSVGSSGSGPASIAVGDFNGDGVADLAIVQSSQKRVAVLLGKTDGTLSPAQFYPTGTQPVAIVVADFNGDGRQDLAVANQNCSSSWNCGNDGAVSILLGNGDGTFQPQNLIVSGLQPSSMAIGDVNNDGKADLVIANGSLNSVVVLLGNGNGTFQAPLEFSTSGAATSVTLGDFNQDGAIDVAVGLSSATVSMFQGKGNGTFQHATDLPALDGVNAVLVSDFNGDGIPDLAVTYAQESAVSIVLGNGDGTFQPRLDFLTGIYPTALATGDFNGDGHADVVVTNGDDQTFSILLGNGNGTLQAAQNFALPAGPMAVAVQDFNRDGKADLAMVLSPTGTVSIVLGRGDGTFPSPQPYGDSLGSWGIAAGDLNGDGNLDLVTTNLLDNSITVFPGAGDGTFAVGPSASAGPVPVAAAVADFNHDGRLDLAVVNQTCTSLPCSPGSVWVFLGNGDGTFQSPTAYATGNIPVGVTVADFNGDGIPDLAVVNYGFGTSDTVSLLLGNGDGTFRSGGALVTGIGPVQAAAADFDGNGATDLVVATSTGISVILGRGAGVFGPRTDYPIAGGTSAIAVGDFNGDGKSDLAVTTLAGSVVVLLGNGDGTFQAGVSYALNSVTDADAILVGDFSGDGKPDLLVGKSTNAVSILVGNGDGTFQPAVDIPLGKAERGWAAGDFDGDGALDVAAASVGLNAVSVILNPPVMALYPAGLNFGGQLTGTTSAPAAVTVSNPGGAPFAISAVTVSGPFTVANGCPATLASGSTCTVSVSFSPLAAGNAGGVLTLTDNAYGGSQNVPLQGTGMGEPAVSVSPSSLTFSPQNVGTSSVAANVQLTNTGSAPLGIQSVSVSGDFTETDNCTPGLPVGGQCNLAVTFAPSGPGTRQGVLTFVDSAPPGSQLVSLTGTGVAKPVAGLSTSSLSFLNQKVNTASSAQTFTLSNSGNAPLQISSIDATGDFSVANNCPASLGAGANCTLSVTFSPAAVGMMAGTVNITDNANDSPQSVALTGTGTDPVASLSTSSVSFASQVVGSSSPPQSLALSNSGNVPLALSGVSVSGPNASDFSLQKQCGASLAPATSCGITLTFTPTGSGTRAATLSLTSDSLTPPPPLALSGLGADFSIGPSAGSAAALTVSPGQQAVFHLTVSPGGIQTAISFTCAGMPSQSTCQVSPAAATMDGVTPLALNMVVQTTGSSAAVLPLPHTPGGRGTDGTPEKPILLAILVLMGVMLATARRRATWAIVALALTMALIAGCGGGGQTNGVVPSPRTGTPTGAYALTVTATSEGISHSASVTLNVKN